jgi:hypothetical protein
MIAQLFFTMLLLIVVLYAWAQYRRSPAIGLLSVLAAIAGLYFVWMPSHATRLAELLGIGRGVDLVIYTWVAFSLIALLNLHLKLRAQMELITVLARELALTKASRDAPPPAGRPGPAEGSPRSSRLLPDREHAEGLPTSHPAA